RAEGDPDPRLKAEDTSAAPAEPLLPRADLAGVETGQVQAAVEAGVLDLHAAVHHHRQPRALGERRGLLVPGAELQPQRGGARVDGLLGDAGQVVVAAEA